jgi:NAD+ diphosphatase
MEFVSLVTPPPELEAPHWWLVFRGSDLLVDADAGVPREADVASIGVSPVRIHFIGSLGAHGCYAAEVAADTAPPPGYDFRGLRSLYGVLSEPMLGIAARSIQVVDWDRTHQFCGRCGAAVVSVDGERAKRCPECGLSAYPRISPAIIVAVIRNGRILLAHNERFPEGLFSLVAGYVDPGETLEECVRREVREEVGITLRQVRYFGSQSWPFPNSLMVGFVADHGGGEISVDEEEITEAHWFEANELPWIPPHGSISSAIIDWFRDIYGDS